MKRAIILLLDSFGVGASADAAQYGDANADTFGHIAAACAAGKANRPGIRQGPLNIPHLTMLGIGKAAEISSGHFPAGLDPNAEINALFGCATENSKGKDTPSGHWEIAGVPVQFDWGYFSDTIPSFPSKINRNIYQSYKNTRYFR